MLELKNSVFWDITSSSDFNLNWYFRGVCYLHLQGQRISQRSACHKLSCWFLAWLILQHWRWRHCALLKHQLSFNRLHGLISQKTELFLTTAVRPQILHNAGVVGRLAQFTAEHTMAWWYNLPWQCLNTNITQLIGLKKAMQPLQLKSSRLYQSYNIVWLQWYSVPGVITLMEHNGWCLLPWNVRKSCVVSKLENAQNIILPKMEQPLTL
jgi:hypothetical protein